MRIVVVNEKYYPNVSGGAEKSVRFLCEGLTELGHNVSVITYYNGRNFKTSFINGVEIYQLPFSNIYYPFDNSQKKTKISKYLYRFVDGLNFLMASKIVELVQKIKPNVVHTNNLFGMGPLLLKKIHKLGYPIVHTIRDYFFMCPYNSRFNNGKVCLTTCTSCKPLHFLYGRYSQYVDSVVGVSKHILNKHCKSGFFKNARHYQIFNSFIAKDQYNKRKISKSTSSAILGYLGRIVPEKGLEQLLNVLSKYKNGWKLHIAGKGSSFYVKDLKSRFSSKNIIWHEWMKPDSFYKLVDWIVISSKYEEPLSRIGIETTCHSIPIISSNLGGMPEILRYHPNAYLYNPDSNELDGLISKVVHKELFIKPIDIKQRDKIQFRFHPHTIAKKYLKAYEQTVMHKLLH